MENQDWNVLLDTGISLSRLIDELRAEIGRLSGEVRSRILDYFRALDEPIVEDLGDYLPFLAYFGESDLCTRHVNGCEDSLLEYYLPYEREDTLLGLLETYRWTGYEEALNQAKRLADHLLHAAMDDGRLGVETARYISHTYQNGRNTRLEFIERRAVSLYWKLSSPMITLPRNGVFIELLVDLHDLCSSGEYIEAAIKMADGWLGDEGFRETGLFPSFRLNPLSGRYSIVAKQNTAVVNGLIALYNRTRRPELREAVLRWSEALSSKCIEGGFLHGRYDFTGGSRDDPGLVYSFAAIETLCYASRTLGEDGLLEIAARIAEPWLGRQSELGLFPFVPDSVLSHQDYTNDFTISLWALWELTRDDRYLESSLSGIRGLLRYHVFPLKVHVRTGGVEDPKVTPKYVGLLSKPIILLEEGSIYGREAVFKLLRDR